MYCSKIRNLTGVNSVEVVSDRDVEIVYTDDPDYQNLAHFEGADQGHRVTAEKLDGVLRFVYSKVEDPTGLSQQININVGHNSGVIVAQVNSVTTTQTDPDNLVTRLTVPTGTTVKQLSL